MAPKKQVDKGKAPMTADDDRRRVTRSRVTGVVIREPQEGIPRRAQAEGYERQGEPRIEEAAQPEGDRDSSATDRLRPEMPGPSLVGEAAPSAQGTMQDNSAMMAILVGISQTLQEVLQAQRRAEGTSIPQAVPREADPVVEPYSRRAEARVPDPTMQWQPDPELNMKAFHSMKPPIFTGEGDFRVVDAWLDGMEKVFAYMKCPEGHKVPYAVYKLEGEAERWWQVERQTLHGDGMELSWPEFKVRFSRYYVPASERTRRATEFLSLIQGKRTVEEYNLQFRTLARFVPWAQSDARETAQRFQNGLRPSIRRHIVPLMLTHYEDILDRARVVELEEEEFSRLRDRKRLGRDLEQGQKQRPRGGQEGRVMRGVCYICRQPGHRATECQANPRVQEGQKRRSP